MTEPDPAYTDYGPFYYVAMPINADGQGPEMDPSKVVRVQHEVWNQLNLSLGEFDSEQIARWVAKQLNKAAGLE